MGKRILITTFGSFGDVHPYITLGRALIARGHQVTFATAEFYRDYIAKEGIGFHPVRPSADVNDRELVARIMDRRSGTELLIRQLLMPAVRDAYEDLADAARGADLIITHPATYAAPIVAQLQKLPWVSTVLAPIGFFSAYDFPVVPTAPWLKRIDGWVPAARVLRAISHAVTRRWSEPVYALRRELGLPRGADPVHEGQFSPQCVLCLYSRVLGEPQPDWPPNAHITGFLFHDRSAPVAPELAAFIDAGPPPIVFTLGSSAIAAAGRFYHESIDAARRLGRRAILLTGQHYENRFDEPLPDGMIAVEYAPHDVVFERAAAVVHQGGIGTLGQALRAGHPMLVVPHAHDQPDNAWRAQRLGISATLYPERYTGERAAALLAPLLDDAVQQRAREVAARVRAEDGLGTACDRIEAMLGPAAS